MPVPVLTVPGLWNSGPQHWQTRWEEKHPEFRRVQQRDFDCPDRGEWVHTLDAAIRSCPSPPILAAHSLGCVLVAEWAAEEGGRGVLGAFLVAPSDVEAPTYPVEGRSFSQMPRTKLPFPSIVVTSTNDEYVSVERARQFAGWWGGRIVLIEAAGHINGASGHGPWPEGEELLEELCRSVSNRAAHEP